MFGLTVTPNPILDGGQEIITDFAATYGPVVLVIMAAAIGIGLAIWGFRKLVSLFRSQAK